MVWKFRIENGVSRKLLMTSDENFFWFSRKIEDFRFLGMMETKDSLLGFQGVLMNEFYEWICRRFFLNRRKDSLLKSL